MPLYDWECSNCGTAFAASSTIADRDDPYDCPLCFGVAERKFSPSTNIVIPGHFRLSADWALPDAGDTAGWEARGNRSQQTAPKREDFKSWMEKRLAGGG